jgi:hypothetical protein
MDKASARRKQIDAIETGTSGCISAVPTMTRGPRGLAIYPQASRKEKVVALSVSIQSIRIEQNFTFRVATIFCSELQTAKRMRPEVHPRRSGREGRDIWSIEGTFSRK